MENKLKHSYLDDYNPGSTASKNLKRNNLTYPHFLVDALELYLVYRRFRATKMQTDSVLVNDL